MKNHEKIQPFHCTACFKKFTTIKKLDSHFSSAHKERYIEEQMQNMENNLSCSKCSKTFTHQHKLNSHMIKEHDVKKPFACAHCDYSSIFKWALHSHILRHHEGKKMKPKQFLCPQCPKMLAGWALKVW